MLCMSIDRSGSLPTNTAKDCHHQSTGRLPPNPPPLHAPCAPDVVCRSIQVGWWMGC
jgi:hypothetical protein